jgi:hypothetical protein
MASEQPISKTSVERRPLPAPATPDKREIQKRIDADVAGQQRTLATRCEQCHVSKLNSDLSPAWFEVAPVNVPSVWWEKARFDHRPHRDLACIACHTGAYEQTEQTGKSWRDNDRVLLPAKETCVKCHAAASAIGKKGARFDCVECHDYHGLEVPTPFLRIDEESDALTKKANALIFDFLQAPP